VQNRIKELREEKKMTQLRLGIELGVTQETISAYEVGKHYPSVNSLIKIAELFHSSLDYIMGLSDIRLPVSANGLPENEATALSLFRALNGVQKEKAMSFMQGMLG
jgi:transcriptional regulator with XRE-family HTH domain